MDVDLVILDVGLNDYADCEGTPIGGEGNK